MRGVELHKPAGVLALRKPAGELHRPDGALCTLVGVLHKPGGVYYKLAVEQYIPDGV